MFCAVVAILALCTGLVQLLYLIFARKALSVAKTAIVEAPAFPFVSVIICARNEALNLQKRLPAVLEQQYPSFEVLVMDDGSEDNTAVIITDLQKRYSNLRYRKIQPAEKPFPGKKGALQIAVAEASHEALLLTDADCRPASPFWIQHMAGALSKEKEIVAGYGPYEKAPGFLNAFVRAETLWIFLQIKVFLYYGVAYMAVGRNLCVRKETFLRASRNPLWSKTLSGDDDMLMRICATPQNTAIVDFPESYMYSPAKKDWKAYRHQKQRHLSTGKYYRLSVQFLLALLSSTHILTWLLLPFGVCCFWADRNLWMIAALGIFAFRTTLFSFLFFRQGAQQKETFPTAFALLFDITFAFYPLFFTPYIFWKNKDKWK